MPGGLQSPQGSWALPTCTMRTEEPMQSLSRRRVSRSLGGARDPFRRRPRTRPHQRHLRRRELRIFAQVRQRARCASCPAGNRRQCGRRRAEERASCAGTWAGDVRVDGGAIVAKLGSKEHRITYSASAEPGGVPPLPLLIDHPHIKQSTARKKTPAFAGVLGGAAGRHRPGGVRQVPDQVRHRRPRLTAPRSRRGLRARRPCCCPGRRWRPTLSGESKRLWSPRLSRTLTRCST